jgi:hypothetical protein
MYTHLALVDGGARVPYASGTFSGDLLVDREGCVIKCPKIGGWLAVAAKLSKQHRQSGPGTPRPGST